MDKDTKQRLDELSVLSCLYSRLYRDYDTGLCGVAEGYVQLRTERFKHFFANAEVETVERGHSAGRVELRAYHNGILFICLDEREADS